MERSKKGTPKDKTVVRVLRRLGHVALGRTTPVDDGRLYDEVMQGSLPQAVHRRLFRAQVASF